MSNPETVGDKITDTTSYNIFPENGVISQGNAGKVIITVLLLFIIIYVVIYVYKLYNSTSLKTTTLLKKPISIPYTSTNITRDLKIPDNINANQYSMSLWTYVDEISPTSQSKIIVGRGTETSLKPVIYINSANKLCIGLGDIAGPIEMSDVFPTNRWVNVVIVVDETLAQVYIDGQYKKSQPSSTLFTETTGNIYIGKVPTYEKIEGYISKIQLFNYALTIDHTKIIYKAGPLHKSILSMIGIPMYGLRNPFVKLDEVNVE